MRLLLTALLATLVAVTAAPNDADARRLGGGGSFGMQRSMPAGPAAPNVAPKPAPAPAATPATPGTQAAAAAAPRRSWMGPIAGLAAGLGLAALMSHLGLGAEFANLLMILLLGVAAIVAIRFVLRRLKPTPTMATAGGSPFGGTAATSGRSALGDAAWNRPASTGAPSTVAAPVAELPEPRPATTLPRDFDAAAFERLAKMIFIRLQAANDAGDLDDLRAFTTPEMFAAIKLELQERGGVAQRTDVVRIDAEVLDVATEAERQVVSVRFHGLIREETEGGAAPFDEVWHLVRPVDGSREWAIAGIQQMG